MGSYAKAFNDVHGRCEVQAVRDGKSEDLGPISGGGRVGGQHDRRRVMIVPPLRRAIIEGTEVGLVCECQDTEADDDTDGGGTGVD